MSDDLTKPLGLSPPRASRGRPRWLAIAAAAVVLVVVAGAGFWWLRPAPGGPTATAVIDQPATPAPATAKPPADIGAAQPAADAGLTEIEPGGSLSEVGKIIIRDPSQAQPISLSSVPAADLIETGPYGPLPKIAADGTRPLDAYARPPYAASRTTRVAVVIGGVGIDADGSQQAIALPGPVTLALAPYGADLKATMTDAREAGHELLLQLPLEPFNYPSTDPGPQTLTVEATEPENMDRLHWLMGRFTNYVGVVNYLGARFTGEADALTPVLADLGHRGLLYLDDGSSARSRAMELAGNTPVLRADVVLDADLTPAAIDQRLDQLRAIARKRGYAIATGSAFAATIDRVAAFARTAADRGVTIVPVSSLIAASRS
jgi:polysaccharide deacetylase 2 family uncharacterized protein YibQ